MRTAFLAPAAAFVAALTAAPAFAQYAGKPFLPRGGGGVFLTQPQIPADVRSFETYRDFYVHIAKERGLADPEGDFAVQQIESHTSLEHLRDYSGEPITVVKLDATRPGDNSSFFVLREKEDHLRLLGEMNARSFESSIASGHLEFVLDVGRHVAQAPRYQVDGDFLINLADLASLDRNDPVELDIKHAF
jgi:hypothetical protein